MAYRTWEQASESLRQTYIESRFGDEVSARVAYARDNCPECRVLDTHEHTITVTNNPEKVDMLARHVERMRAHFSAEPTHDFTPGTGTRLEEAEGKLLTWRTARLDEDSNEKPIGGYMKRDKGLIEFLIRPFFRK